MPKQSIGWTSTWVHPWGGGMPPHLMEALLQGGYFSNTRAPQSNWRSV